MPNVSNIVKSIQDIMRKDAGTYGDAQRLEQLGWMFFLKIFDDREEELELRLDNYTSPLSKNLRWRNWAKDEGSSDNSSAHNISYWQSQDWWGYGPGAHSHVGGVRWWNVKHPSAYSTKLASGLSPAAGRETLDSRTRLEERILLEIRVAPGLSVQLAKEVNPEAAKLIAGFIADELVDPKSALAGQLTLTLKGRLLADSLVRQLLG